MPEHEHNRWMNQALRLARKGWGRTSPNPMVGAVLVRNGLEVGSGYHRKAGEPHAEVNALRQAGAAARGATCYVTLEPCSTHGRTPPCTQALLEAGVARVVIGCLDPNPHHAGRAVQLLAAHGIATEVGVRETVCATLNEAFFHWIRTGRPFVLLKMAMTLDGKIATAGGNSRWITSPTARREVQRLRQWADAIMVGGETVRRDNPSLTVRTPKNWWRQPHKIVWTRNPEFPQTMNIHADPDNPPEFVATESPRAWDTLLERLGQRQITSLLVEGGGELAAACLRNGVVDKVAFFIAPKLLGGRNSRPVVGGDNPRSLDQALSLTDLAVKRIGPDLLITGYPAPCSQD